MANIVPNSRCISKVTVRITVSYITSSRAIFFKELTNQKGAEVIAKPSPFNSNSDCLSGSGGGVVLLLIRDYHTMPISAQAQRAW